ncbi:MAG TPA: Gfo/Idh/MocA family oxidoreductase [Verrucomicrobiales bacterium]|nr:Gfo/Idh/MocA family oxidoreductase [Verrucomicrobiales bacterium]
MKKSTTHSIVTSDSPASISRRKFCGTAVGALGLGLTFPAILRSQSPNSKMNVAVIGSGGRGGHNLRQVGASENIVALCDVNHRNLERASEQFPQAKMYTDFRQLYADKMENLDAVVVSTTEHTHAFAVLPALRAGKHVYCEKPLSRDVAEARWVTQAAAKAGVATQMGTQIHAGNNYRRVVELIQAGAIGNVTEVHVWVSRAWGHQSPEDAKLHRDIVSSVEKPSEAMTPPDYLDWDLWIGPAPFRPYHEIYFPGPKWYRWWDFGNGTMSDLGSHWNDLPFWALKLDAPRTVVAGGPDPHPEIAPASMWAKYSYGPRPGMSALELTWHQGVEKPEIWKSGGIPQWKNAVLFIGDEGMLLSDYGKHVLLPEEKFKDFQRPSQSIPPSIGHHKEWLYACRTGAPTTCPFSYAGPLTEANHLGNVAFRAGTKIEWDAKNMRISNSSKANQYLKREYREGWSLV